MNTNTRDQERAEIFDAFYAQQDRDGKFILDIWLAVLQAHINKFGEQSAKSLLVSVIFRVA